MNLKFVAGLLMVLLSLSSCVEHKNVIHQNLKDKGQFMLRKAQFESTGCRPGGEAACIRIETDYPEMLFGPALLQQKVNREIERNLGKMLLKTFPYLSSRTPSLQIEELMNLYDYKKEQNFEILAPQKVGLYGSWRASDTDYWVFKLEVWVQNEGEAPIVLQKWISLDRDKAILVASKDF